MILIGIPFLLLCSNGASPSSAQELPRFAGTVQIAGWPADPGTHVIIGIYRAVPGGLPQGLLCAETTVELQSSGVTGYQVSLGPHPACLSSANTYYFWVNGVFAGYASYPGNSMPGYQNLAVGMVALKTGSDGKNVQLFWLSGQVVDRFNRPVAPGTPVEAQAVGGSCHGSGVTTDLSWVPQFAKNQRVDALGYYVVAVPQTPDCVDRQFNFRIFAGGNFASNSTINVFTPPYGASFLADLRIP